MTRKELIKELIPKVITDNLDCSLLSCGCNTKGCKNCDYQNYWDEDVIIPKTVAKSILNSAYGTSYYCDTDSVKIVNDVYHTGKTHSQKLQLIQQGWSKLPTILNVTDWSTLKEIIDDALDHGFEVQILNGTIYYREKQ